MRRNDAGLKWVRCRRYLCNRVACDQEKHRQWDCLQSLHGLRNSVHKQKSRKGFHQPLSVGETGIAGSGSSFDYRDIGATSAAPPARLAPETAGADFAVPVLFVAVDFAEAVLAGATTTLEVDVFALAALAPATTDAEAGAFAPAAGFAFELLAWDATLLDVVACVA